MKQEVHPFVKTQGDVIRKGTGIRGKILSGTELGRVDEY
jgi:hypothetical protein